MVFNAPKKFGGEQLQFGVQYRDGRPVVKLIEGLHNAEYGGAVPLPVNFSTNNTPRSQMKAQTVTPREERHRKS